jgi:hypothetical protein
MFVIKDKEALKLIELSLELDDDGDVNIVADGVRIAYFFSRGGYISRFTMPEQDRKNLISKGMCFDKDGLIEFT